MTNPATRIRPGPDTKIWRYMDDWKFAYTLARFSDHDLWRDDAPGKTHYANNPGQLWFSFPRSLAVGSGGAEGEIPDRNLDPEQYCDSMAQLMKLSDAEASERKKQFLAANTGVLRDASFYMAQLCGVSCWHENDEESEDMWNCNENDDGVAVETTCSAVEYALSHAHNSYASKARPSICAVEYVDHQIYFLPADGFRNLLVLVRYSWSDENEVRFVAKSPNLAKIQTTIRTPVSGPIEQWQRILDSPDEQTKQQFISEIATQCRDAFALSCGSNSKGFFSPIKLDDLYGQVVLSPTCSPTYESTVQARSP